ncbi:MAG: glycoside hydrolase family 78 protein [Puniceicoccales bacterium]|jgi:alpha-L-rhamnosidase|nr:glycoside hydrolase family 78 protein [Puniceicoccales bacterium]
MRFFPNLFSPLAALLTCALPVLANAAGSFPYDLRCEYLRDPISVDTLTPRLSWKIKSDVTDTRQTAVRILVCTTENALKNAMKTPNNNTAAAAVLWDAVFTTNAQTILYKGKPLDGQKIVFWAVQPIDEKGIALAWSEPARFGSGLTREELASAFYIGFPKNELPKLKVDKLGVPAVLFRKKITANKGTSLLYVNSLGYHEVFVNNKRVGNAVLSPAVSQYDKRSFYNTYDITPYLIDGENELTLALGSGWYKKGLPGVARSTPLLKTVLAQRTSNEKWQVTAVTDNTWESALAGYFDMGNWRYRNFVGERVVRSFVDAPRWFQAVTIDAPKHLVVPQMAEDNIIVKTLPARSVKEIKDGAYLYDFGENIIGWADVRFNNLSNGQEIRLEHAEFLDATGDIGGKENQRDPNSSYTTIDYYVAAGADDHFRNRFHYHGFRYLKISGLNDAQLPKENVNALQISADTGTESISSFESSDADLNAIHDLIKNTFRNLIHGGYLLGDASYERLGYGGEGHKKTLVTAQTFFNTAPLFSNWLDAWGDCMKKDGGLPHTAPSPYNAGGGPFWCAIIVNAPWSSYINYDDIRTLKKHYPHMKRWLAYVEKFMRDGLLQKWENVPYRSRGWYLGDWATPPDPNDDKRELRKYWLGLFPSAVSQWKKESIDLVNNCAVSECYDIAAATAHALGDTAGVAHFTAKRDALNKRLHEVFFNADKNSYATGSQCDTAFILNVGAVPEKYRAAVVKKLKERTQQRHDGGLATGFVGLQVLAEWAINDHEPDFFYGMLKRRGFPGYLYMLEKGATATWEHWNGKRSHIHNCYNGIGTWFYQGVGGIRPDPNFPGYKRFIVDPQIPRGVKWTKIKKPTPFGIIESEWKLCETDTEKNKLQINLTIPVGTEAEIQRKGKTIKILGSGRHTVTYCPEGTQRE